MFEAPDDIVCFELGSNQLPWVGPSADFAQDYDAIQLLVQDGVVQYGVRDGEASISGVDRVGLLQLPSGRRIVIRSKIESLVLLDWLAFLGDFPPLDKWLADAGVITGDDFPTCLGRLFLRELESITRVHLRKDFTSVISDNSIVHGRILMSQLSRKLHCLPRLPQFHRSRTLNTPYNMVLALALDKVQRLLTKKSLSDTTLLARLRDEWSIIRRNILDPSRAVTEVQWGCPSGYRTALQLARLILVGAALDPEAGVGGQAFTLSLSSIWERALRQMINEIGGEAGWVSARDSDRTRMWDDSAGRNDPNRWLTVDVMAEREGVRWILDAKYKRAFGNESREDRFQMCAYAVAFDADVVSLVYPVSTKDFQRRVLLETKVGLKPITIDSLNLPMCAGPEFCKAALRSLSGSESSLQL
ncbi:MAG: hypothetical protein JWP89_846 [Schlesneria sp.]|nr:hypothetical protein [Schlesneria sp.]